MEGNPDDLDAARSRLPVLALLSMVAVIGAVDLYLDRPARWLSPHVLVEIALVLVSGGTAWVLWRGWRRASTALAGVRRTLVERESELWAWRARAESAMAGFNRAVDEQCAAWGLTPAEREVAILLLKGSGHKQIAAQTGRSERTVRQHAVAVYEKSGLRGRAELAAFFLDALR